MKETYVKWEPVEGLSEKYYIDAVLDGIEGFSVEFSSVSSGKRIRVMFEESVDAYRSTDESFRLKTIYHRNQKGSGPWSFFKVENSRYIQWIKEESLETAFDKLIHFSFIGYEDSILDVVTTYEPTIEFVE